MPISSTSILRRFFSEDHHGTVAVGEVITADLPGPDLIRMSLTPPQLPRPTLIPPGTVIDHFKIIRLIGRGGMGEVYLARDLRLGRKVALKIINRAAILSSQTVERFLFEARATALFSHPNIVAIHYSGQFDDRPYVALEYLQGQNLRARIRESPLGVKEAMRIMQAVAEALKEAHAHQILHRDLKPENVLIPKDGRIRVVDFGLAEVLRPTSQQMLSTERPVTVEEELTSTEELFALDQHGVRGSPPYMAPEQWLEKPTSGATDIWAVGILLFELVFGRRPFRENSVVELAAQVVSDEPVPIPEAHDLSLNQTLPADLVILIGRCLNKKQEARPTAVEVARLLDLMLHRGHGRLSEEECPFRGLFPFTERHSEIFFGRDTEILEFMERVRDQAVLPVVGPSGSGKSSFVQAGIIPRLREHKDWVVLMLRPGNEPFRTLATRLISGETLVGAPRSLSLPSRFLRSQPDETDVEKQITRLAQGDEAALAERLHQEPFLLSLILQRLAAQEGCRVLLFVDQLEELHTLVENEEVRRRFMTAICSAADDSQDPVRVIFTLREDFISRLTLSAQARAVMGRVTVMHRPDASSIEQTLVRPLEAVGYQFDDMSIVHRMVDSVQQEQAALPLLQFTARMLWERRDRKAKVLRQRVYEEMGGVGGALAVHADGILDGLSTADQRLARDLFLSLVTPQQTRKVVSRAQLVGSLGTEVEPVLDQLIAAHLLTLRKTHGQKPTDLALELVHESLIRSWKRLARWIDDSREDLSFLHDASAAADLWQRRGSPEAELWSGKALTVASDRLSNCTAPIPDLVRSFIEAGRRKERLRVRRARALWAGLLLVLLGLVLVFYQQKSVAERQRALAVAEKRKAKERLVETLLEGARSAIGRKEFLEARARLRSALELRDSPLTRGLWWRLDHEPLLWSRFLGGTVYDVAISPDGKTIAAACQDKAIYLVEAATGIYRVLRGSEDQVFSLAFSPDGKQLASGAYDGALRIWTLEDESVQVLKGHALAVRALAFSPDGNLLVSGSYDRTLRFWPLAHPGPVRVVKAHDGFINGLAFSSDGTLVASASDDKTVKVWRASDGTLAQVFRGHVMGVYGVAFAPSGKLLASGGADHRLLLWDAASGRLQASLSGHRDRINDVAFSPDGTILASASFDRTICIWSVKQRRVQKELRGHTQSINRLAFGPRSHRLASVGFDRSVRYWDLTATPLNTGQGGHRAQVHGVSFSPSGEQIASAALDRMLRLWDVKSGRTLAVTLPGHDRLNAVVFHPSGQRLAVASGDGLIYRHTLPDLKPLRPLPGHRQEVLSLAFSPDGQRLVSGASDGSILQWSDGEEAPSGLEIGRHRQGVNALVFSPDGQHLASSSQDGTIQVRGVSDRGSPRVLTGHAGTVWGLAFDTEGQTLYSGGADKTLRRWDLTAGTGQVLATFPGRIYMLAISPDRRMLALPLSDGSVRVTDLSGTELKRLLGHHREVNYLAFSPTGSHLVSSSDDGTLRLWGLPGGQPIWRAKLLDPVAHVVFNHLGRKPLLPSEVALPLPTRWEQAIQAEAALASRLPNSPYLCLTSTDEELQIWNIQENRQLSGVRLPGVDHLQAVAKGCVAVVAGQARFHTIHGGYHKLAEGTTALDWDGESLLLATDTQIQIFSGDGSPLRSLPGTTGISALTRVGSDLVLGFQEGSIERRDIDSNKRQVQHPFEQVPSCPVVRLLPLPNGLIAAGFGNGELGIWTMADGTLLQKGYLHGPVTQLAHDRGLLMAVSELGDDLTLDLRASQLTYPDLKREVWQRVPVIWSGGRPVLQGQPVAQSPKPKTTE